MPQIFFSIKKTKNSIDYFHILLTQEGSILIAGAYKNAGISWFSCRCKALNHGRNQLNECVIIIIVIIINNNINIVIIIIKSSTWPACNWSCGAGVCTHSYMRCANIFMSPVVNMSLFIKGNRFGCL